MLEPILVIVPRDGNRTDADPHTGNCADSVTQAVDPAEVILDGVDRASAAPLWLSMTLGRLLWLLEAQETVMKLGALF